MGKAAGGGGVGVLLFTTFNSPSRVQINPATDQQNRAGVT